MKKMQMAFVTLGLAVAATGCATHTINYKNPTAPAGGATLSAKQSFFLWGLVGGSEVDLVKMCPTGVSQIQSKTSVGDQLFTIFTGGIYSPMSVNVQCATGGSVATGGAQ
jgi:hypothetical protein